ncbi:hypothetical protein ACEYYB_08915 [Paracoccus sp. p4-l81]|uniref:hypothetical protein n=1 Tax=Paracoccus sp. p4-l81 TaxID=3342806 RepID=UPI0035B7DD57
MKNTLSKDAVLVPSDLRKAMHEAHAALLEKRDHVGRLKAARDDVNAAIATDKAAMDEAKAAYVAGFSDAVDGPNGDPKAPQRSRRAITDLGGRIFAAEQTLPDFAAAIAAAEAELRSKHQAFTVARRQIAAVFWRHNRDARDSAGDLIPFKAFLDDDGKLDLRAALTLYMGSYFEATREQGNAFPDMVSPQHFFAFIASFFRVPSRDDVAGFAADFERLIWGDGEPPPPVAVPPAPLADIRVHGFDF